MDDARFKVKVEQVSRAVKVPKELISELEVAGKSMVGRMRREAVDCPVLGYRVSFIQCFLYSNLLRRFRSIVYCKGEPLGG
ncbi:MAG: hypothetical protein N3E44_02825 [Candidatus Bathyarchaeota archaeon]|nr:hypothetical protein [Candidatus Bathyarchaeota archaeon]